MRVPGSPPNNTMNQEIEKLLDQLNFENIREHMARTGWVYHSDKEAPSISQLRETARHVLEIVANNQSLDYSCATGGFFAFKEQSEGNEPAYRILFAIEDADNYE